MAEDVKEGEAQAEEPSTDAKTEESVPYDRFKEVVDERNQARDDLSKSLDKDAPTAEQPQTGLTDTEKAEKAAQDYIDDRASAKVKEILDERSATETQEQAVQEAEKPEEPTPTPEPTTPPATPTPQAEPSNVVAQGFGLDGRELGFAFFVENPNAGFAIEDAQYQIAAYNDAGAVVRGLPTYV